MNYKAPDNSLHFIDPEFEHLLPAGSVQITEEEAKALVSKPSVDSLKNDAIKNVRTLRAPVFAALAGMQSQSLTNGDVKTAKTISDLQDKLKALPETDLSKCTSKDDIDSTFMKAWQDVLTTVPAGILSAFVGVSS